MMVRPPLGKMLRRGLIRRCALCGGKGAWYTGWYKKQDRCKSCGFKWERNQVGNSLGAMTMSVIITFFLILMTIGIGSILTYPDISVVPIILVSVGIVAVVPGFLYPICYTFWFGVDLFMNAPSDEELADAAAHMSGNA
jgi:uncharacterized protein (DUF983 family)